MSYVSFLKKAAQMAKHDLEKWILKAVSVLKQCILFRTKARALFDYGKDAAERLAKDGKLTLTYAAAGYGGSLRTMLDEIRGMLGEEDNKEKLRIAESEDKPLHARLIAFFPLLVSSMEQMLSHEVSINVCDCLEAKAAKHQTTMELAVNKLRANSQGYFSGGPHDWRQAIDETASLDEMLEKAAQTIGKVKSVELGTDIKSLDKASKGYG